MKIKLAILEKDQIYLNRFVSYFEEKYADQIQIHSFTDMDVAISDLGSEKIDVMIANDAFEVDMKRIPKRCGVAYFVDSWGVETKNDQLAICKFQKAELIYKQILSVYSENANNISGFNFGDDSSKIIFFQPVSGGVGASSMAAACAMHFAAKEKKTLYLNFERFGSSDSFFAADGQFDMYNVIYALKKKNNNLAMKLESYVKHASNGVFFYSSPQSACHMMEFSFEDALRLISELKITGSYDYIIVDMDFSIEPKALELYRKAHAVVWVGDGSAISNHKFTRAFNALSAVEANADSPIMNRIVMLYNKYSNKISKKITNIDVNEIGGVPRFEHATSEQVLANLCKMDMFDKIM